MLIQQLVKKEEIIYFIINYTSDKRRCKHVLTIYIKGIESGKDIDKKFVNH